MFERFDDDARKVFPLATEHARRLGQPHLGTEHILLGLIAEGDGAAARVLPTHGADLDRVRQQVLHTLEGQSVGGSTVATNKRAQAQPSSAPSGDLAARLDVLERKLDETLDRLDGIEKRLPPR